MTHFEYLSVAVSIVLSLGLVRLVGGFRSVMESTERHWLILSWIVILIALFLGHWWTSWSFRGAEWTFPKFVMVLGGPAILYFTATAIVPDDPKAVQNWRDFYFLRRRELYIGLLAYMVFSIFDGFLVLDAPLLAAPRSIQGIAIVLALIGIASKNPITHGAITVLYGLLFAVSALTLIATPDATIT